MVPAPLPPNEKERLAALSGYRIMDSEPEPSYDDIVTIASTICGTPISLVSLVDDHRQWFKAKVGLDATETDRDFAFCAHAILDETTFEVPDAAEDVRFRDNPLVLGDPRIRFYAGHPIVSSEGLPLGTLCVIDRIPRTLDESQRTALQALARQVGTLLELRRRTIDLNAAMLELDEQRRRAESLADKFRAASEARGDFVATLSHEIRTPMNGVLGLATLLQESSLNSQQSRWVRIMRSSGEAMVSLLDDVLDLSRIEAGGMEIERVATGLRALVDGCVGSFEAVAARKGVALEGLVADDVPEQVVVDPLRLRQILSNMIGNALKFTDHGYVKVSCAKEGDGLAFDVSDTGEGISEAALGKLFQRFAQADASVSRQHGGTGLGLSICKGLVEKMEGKISVTSEVGRGTTFKFSIPLELAESIPEAPGEVDWLARLAPFADTPILLADDDLLNREMGRAILELLGFTSIRVSEDGDETLKELGNEPAGLVLLDVQMPGTDAPSIVRKLRSGAVPGSAADVPILVLSGESRASVLDAVRAAGADGRVEKPINTPLLAAEIERVLKARR